MIDYISDLFNIDNNTTATIVITIAVFLTGLAFQGLFSFIKNLSIRCRKRRFFIHVLDKTGQASLKQGNLFNDFSKKLAISYVGNFELSTITFPYLSTFDKIDFELVYNAFFNGPENLCSQYKTKAFTKAYSIISRIQSIESKYPTDLQKFIDKFNGYEDKWYNAVELIRQQYEQILGSSTEITVTNPLVADFLTRMDGIISSWQRQINYTHYSTEFNSLVNPLYNLLKEPQFESIALRSKQLLNLLIEAQGHYQNMVSLLENYSSLYQLYGRIYCNSLRIIKVIVKILK